MTTHIRILALVAFSSASFAQLKFGDPTATPEFQSSVLSGIKLTEIKPTLFLESLKASPRIPVRVGEVDRKWFKKGDLEAIVLYLNDKTPCSAASSELDSYLRTEASTVAIEACVMIRGYIDGVYPPRNRAKAELFTAAEAIKWVNDNAGKSSNKPTAKQRHRKQ